MSKVFLCLATVGRSAYVEDLATGLPTRGVQPVWIHTDEGPSESLERLEELGQPVHRLPKVSLRNPLPHAWRLARLIVQERPDVVHGHFFPNAAVDLAVARLLGVPAIVLTRNHSTFHHRFFPKAVPIDRMAASVAHRVIAISDIVRSVLVEREKIPPGKISVVHYGIDLERFDVSEDRVRRVRDRWSLDEDRVTLGMLSRYVRLKGIQHVLDAMDRVLHRVPDATLVLANAGGPYASALKERMQRLPPESVVEIPFEQDVEALYAVLDICLHVPDDPWIEAFGKVYLEALAAGVPSVMTRSGIGHRLLEDEMNALVVPYQNPPAIADAVVRLLSDPELRDRIASNARRSVRSFTVEEMVDGISEVYRRVL